MTNDLGVESVFSTSGSWILLVLDLIGWVLWTPGLSTKSVVSSFVIRHSSGVAENQHGVLAAESKRIVESH